MDFFNIIGTLASIGSIPLSIYLFIKSKENNISKTKRDILKVLLHQIGDRRTLTAFEIQTVINSKTREEKISSNKITIAEIIEDLVAEAISNPLLEEKSKEDILLELKNIYFKGEILTQIDKLEVDTRKPESTNSSQIEIELKKIIQARDRIKQNETKLKVAHIRSSQSFAIIAIISTVIIAMLTFFGKENYNEFVAKPIYTFFEEYEFYSMLGLSIFTGIISLFLTVLSKKFVNK